MPSWLLSWPVEYQLQRTRGKACPEGRIETFSIMYAYEMFLVSVRARPNADSSPIDIPDPH